MVSEKLTEIRKQRKLTMKDVAEAIGMKPDTYRNYESGRLEPNLSTLTKLADFYGVTTDIFSDGQQIPRRSASLQANSTCRLWNVRLWTATSVFPKICATV